MTELMADNSEILAFRATSQDASIVVTEEQVMVVHKGGRVMRNHCHSIHATISKDFVVTVDDQRKLNIYNVAQVLSNQIVVARQFQLTSEVHSMAISGPDNDQYLVMNNWNTQSVDIYELKGLLESPSDAITDKLLVRVNIEDYAPFSALDVD